MECNERCDGTAEQFALAADHLFGGNRRQRLVECILSASVVRAAAVKCLLCAWLVDHSGIRRPKHFSHPRNAPGVNDCEARSRYDHLVTDGPFSFTRNPIYLGGTMLVLGIGLVSGIVWFLPLAILAAFTVQKLAFEREERHLQARFGETYLDYAGRVRRWI
jgi:protein-S-isoprenylcysteine O-methyltransferase Ste14